MKKTFMKIGTAVLVGIAYALQTYAALIPTLNISTINNNSQINITVLGADPNSNVLLFYPTASSMSSAVVGNTNANGYFTANINPSQYAIAAGAPVYVLVNGSQSQIQTWPTTTSAPNTSAVSLSVSQSTVSVSTGQSTAVTLTSSNGNLGILSVQSNSNSAVANISISGSQAIINAGSQGSTAVTICSTTAGCAVFTVNVSASNGTQTTQTTSGTISFSNSNVTLNNGQSTVITLSGLNTYYVSSNSNQAIVTTSVSGSQLTISAINPGLAILSVCGSNSYATSCGTVNVTVSGTNTSNSNDVASSTTLVDQPSIALSIGQTKPVNLSTTKLFTGVYYVSSNSNSTSVTANINGNVLSLTGVAYGASNVNVCQQGGSQCANVYVYVAPNADGGNTPTPQNTTAPVISAITVSSNNVGNSFLGSGVTLTVSFNANQPISKATISFAGVAMTPTGTGMGPYSATYTMNNGGAVPVTITVTNASGLTGGAKLTLEGAGSTGSVKPAVPVSSALFVHTLDVGSTGSEVTALQNLLTKLGLYTGPITGKFGAQTEAAVKKYQATKGIKQVGAVGPSTREALNNE